MYRNFAANNEDSRILNSMTPVSSVDSSQISSRSSALNFNSFLAKRGRFASCGSMSSMIGNSILFEIESDVHSDLDWETSCIIEE